MRHRHVFLLVNLSRSAIHDPSRDGKGAWGDGAGASVIGDGIRRKMREDGGRRPRGEQQTDVPDEVLGEDVETGEVGGFGGGAKGGGHDFGFAEEYPERVSRDQYGVMELWRLRRLDPPAVRKVGSDFLEVCVPHILDREHEAVLVGVEGFAHVGVQPGGEFFALFLDLGEVDHLGAL